jgi:hypothetical protein
MNGKENEEKKYNTYRRRNAYAPNKPRRCPQKRQASGSIL